jgi:prevent-host-death family protein
VDLVYSGAAVRTFNIHEAKTHLSRLVDEAVNGEPFVIAKAGKPKVKVVAIEAPKATKKKRIGFMKGAYQLPDNFIELDKKLDKEIEELFLGKGRR